MTHNLAKFISQIFLGQGIYITLFIIFNVVTDTQTLANLEIRNYQIASNFYVIQKKYTLTINYHPFLQPNYVGYRNILYVVSREFE